MSLSLLPNVGRKVTTQFLQRTSSANITTHLRYLLPQSGNGNWAIVFKRSLWGYVAVAFNQVDADRLRQVGPNRLCAEWVVKNGGGVRFTANPTKLWKDYNALPIESQKFKIKVVDASNASVMKIGLEHFKGCEDIDTVIFHNCKHLENDGLEGLRHLKSTLTKLQVSGCHNMADADLAVIGELVNLRQLLLFDMIYVKQMEEVANNLRAKLPECTIQVTEGIPKFA